MEPSEHKEAIKEMIPFLEEAVYLFNERTPTENSDSLLAIANSLLWIASEIEEFGDKGSGLPILSQDKLNNAA